MPLWMTAMRSAGIPRAIASARPAPALAMIRSARGDSQDSSR
jgi:hypothetical protein